MTMYRVYYKSTFEDVLPWSLEDDNYLWRGAYDVIADVLEKHAAEWGRPYVIMRESNEHLDYIEEWG